MQPKSPNLWKGLGNPHIHLNRFYHSNDVLFSARIRKKYFMKGQIEKSADKLNNCE
uniref:Uncharacterized protein n=2 Tax=Aegilops tauschii subsp. strangulata TaxID=200361 RepID=A0A453F789_AEGTS